MIFVFFFLQNAEDQEILENLTEEQIDGTVPSVEPKFKSLTYMNL